MNIMGAQKKYSPKFSFEFFPPRNPEAIGKLQVTQERLAKLNPDYFSVTFGAGGSTRDRTFETVLNIMENTEIEAAPHISCIAHLNDEIITALFQGLKNIMNQNTLFYANINTDMDESTWLDFPFLKRDIEFYKTLANQNNLTMVVLGQLKDLGFIPRSSNKDP